MTVRTLLTNFPLLLFLGTGCQAPETELPSDAPAVAPEPILDPVLIRATEWTEWHYLGELMELSGQSDGGFWKLELEASEGDKERKLLEKR